MSSIMSSLPPVLPPAVPADESRRASAPAKERDWFQPNTESEQSFSFRDFLSVINPLQHIPVVGSIYRAITGDTINPASRVMGSLLFGGPIGLMASALNAMVEQTTGKDLGDQALALLVPDKSTPAPAEPPPAQFAAATPGQPELAPPEAAAPASLSRSLPAPNPVTALGGDRTLGGSLLNTHAGAAAGASAQGRTLADYRNFNGRPLPIIDANRSASSHAAPVRLQPTAPMPERPRTVATPITKEPKALEPAPADGPGGGNTAATASPANEGFVAAMSRGLDRYREQRRIGQGPLQIDTTL